MPESLSSPSRGRLLVRAAVAVMAGLVLAAGAGIWMLRQGAIADTQDDIRRLGTVLAEQTTRSLQSVDFVLQEVVAKVAASGARDPESLRQAMGGREVFDALKKRLADLPLADAFTVVDATGRLVNFTRQWPTPERSMAEREYFKHFAQEADTSPFISEPSVSSTTGARTIFLARRLAAADGTFLGAVVSPLRLDFFSEFFASTGLQDGTGITIVARDGLVLVRYPTGDALLQDARIPPKLPWYDTVASGGGHYTAPPLPGLHGAVYVSVHLLNAYPLVVDVTRTEGATLRRWHGQAMAIGAGVVLAATVLLLLLRALGRQFALIERSRDRIDEQVRTIQASESRLAAQSAMLTATLDHMEQGLMMVDAADRIVLCNRRALTMLDLPADMMAARPRAGDVLAYQAGQGEFDGHAIDPALLASDRAVCERRRPNGTVLEVRTTPLPWGGLVRTYTDITARAKAEEMLGRAASHDQLTGLANRNGFNHGLDAALATAARTGRELALLCLDLDGFKAVNDTLGHAAGDALLAAVAQRLVQSSRGTDLVARLGGDEFAVVLPGAGLADAEQACRRLLEEIRAPYDLGGRSARIGVSIGIAAFPRDGSTAEQLLANADTALYMAKDGGRDTWRAFSTEDGEREHLRRQLEQDVRSALEKQQFTLAYQPICDSGTRAPVAFEALLRWTNPRTGPVSPAEFIPVAERTGLILPLGRWVLEAACREAASWPLPLRIAVNLSPAQFRDEGLLGFVTDVLDRTGLPAHRLELEVTEGLLLEDGEAVVGTMDAMRRMGIHLVLDDFGTAHSNLAYLRGFPFATVKIDRSFLRALSTDPQARALVEAMLAMARALDLDVVGEGVETEEQLGLLCHLRCRMVQGWLLGRPATAEATRALIRAHAASDAPMEVVEAA